MRPVRSTAHGMAVLAACMLAGFASPARAQDIEPRAYSNAPIGVNFLIAGYAYTRGGLSFGPSLPITNREPQYVQRRPRVREGARPVGNVGQVRRDRAVYLALGNGRLQGRTGTAEREWLRQSRVPAVGQSLRRARAHAEGVRRLGAGPDHRRQPSGVGALGPIRRQQARQHRHQSLVLQAGGRDLEGHRAVDAGSARRRQRSTPTTTISSAATRFPRTRSIRCRDT